MAEGKRKFVNSLAKLDAERVTLMIYVIATVELFAGKRNNYLEEFNKIVAAVRAEPGCLEYGPAEDVQTDIAIQEAVADDVIMIVERWTDTEALHTHLKTAHMQSYFEAVATVVKKTGVRILQPIP